MAVCLDVCLVLDGSFGCMFGCSVMVAVALVMSVIISGNLLDYLTNRTVEYVR